MFANKTMYALKQSLDGLALRQKMIAANISNSETPGYKASAVSFEDQLERALSSPSTDFEKNTGLGSVQPVVAPKNLISQRLDGNTVDMDGEMADLAETSLRFEAMTRLLDKKYENLRSIILEGRR